MEMVELHQIRAAQLSDAAEIARLTLELGYPVKVEEIRSRLTVILSSTEHFVAVATGKGSALLGWVVVERRMSLESGEKAELTGLVVDALVRRKGVGKALVSVVEQWAAKKGLPSIRVRSNIARAESHPFYESLGYVCKKTQHAYEKELPSG